MRFDRNRQKGFTLIELMIVVVIVAIIAAIALPMVFGRGSSEQAEEYAHAHARKLGWKVQGLSCAATDSDGNGYISCTVVLEDQSERDLECGSGAWGAWRIKGCKAVKLPSVQRQAG